MGFVNSCCCWMSWSSVDLVMNAAATTHLGAQFGFHVQRHVGLFAACAHDGCHIIALEMNVKALRPIEARAQF